MMKKFILACLLAVLPALSSAEKMLSCTIQLSKTNCWAGHSVTIDPVNLRTMEHGPVISLKEDEFFIEQTFPCESFEQMTFTAKFSPPIWEGKGDKENRAKHIYNVPAKLPEGAKAWVISICFPDDFASVPLPLGDLRNCKCQFKPAQAENSATADK